MKLKTIFHLWIINHINFYVLIKLHQKNISLNSLFKNVINSNYQYTTLHMFFQVEEPCVFAQWVVSCAINIYDNADIG